MSEKFDYLFYNEKLEVASQKTFTCEVIKGHPDIKIKDIQEFSKN